MDSQILLTPSALLDFLNQIDELADKQISVTETANILYVSIGESQYKLDLSDAEDIDVPEEALDAVIDTNNDGYDDVSETEELDSVESGILKQLAKTLLIGGLVRLSAKILGGGKKKK